MTYVGTGMICPHIVNISTLLGAVLSWGVMWPLIGNLKGEWFPTNLSESDMKGLNGYKATHSLSLSQLFALSMKHEYLEKYFNLGIGTLHGTSLYVLGMSFF